MYLKDGVHGRAGTFEAALLSMLTTQREAGHCQHQRTVSKAANRIFCEAPPEQVSLRTQDVSLWKLRKR